jgi:peptidoglycan/LPS O-acetylase OafA/YrhL
MDTSSLPLAHAVREVLWLGWSGVDLFFALSGFLITGILLDSRHSERYFGTFYVRRALRIFPLYFAFLAVMLGLLHHWLWRHRYPGISVWWYFVYLQNWKPNHTAGDLHVDHTWSLAIEEQFYFLWPLVVWRSSRRLLAALTLAFAVIAVLLRCFVAPRFGPEAAYRGSLTRMDGLALGAFMAVAVRTPRLASRVRAALPYGIAISSVALASAFYVQGSFRWDRPVQIWGVSSMAILFSLLVFWCADSKPAVMRCRLLGSFAAYAYGIYVLHSPVNQILLQSLDGFWRRFSPPAAFALQCCYVVSMTAVCWSMGWVSWRYFEGPVNRLKNHFPYTQ